MQSKLEQARQLLDGALFLIRYPDNSLYVCRWCGNSRPICNSNCWYGKKIKEIDSYREKVKAYLAS